MKKNFLQDALAALSLANLSLLGTWDALLTTSSAQTFFLPQAPPPSQYAAAMANVFLIGIVFFVVIRIARLAGDRYGALVSAPILLLITLPAAKALVRILAIYFSSLGLKGSAAVVALLYLAVVLFARKKMFAAGLGVLATLSPLIATEAVLSISRCRAARPAAYANGVLAPLTRFAAHPRIVWIVFDELDYRLTFPGRPAGLDLPEFDRLRAESIFAENALPPGDDTLHSINSMLTGTRLTSILPVDPSHATADGVPLTSRPTVFSTIHGMGGNVAVVGWHLPYCRLFSADLAACSWHDLENKLSDTSGTFAESLVLQQRSLFDFGYTSLLPQSLRARHRIAVIHAMTEESRRDAADPSFDFVFLHMPAPHQPHYYDRATRTFTKRNAGVESYPDSLALADLMLGEIRDSMTRAGLWDTTTVLVTSDHRNRNAIDFDGKTDWRVPYLLKLAGTSAHAAYTAPLQTIVTKALLEAVFDCQVETPAQAIQWLKSHPF